MKIRSGFTVGTRLYDLELEPSDITQIISPEKWEAMPLDKRAQALSAVADMFVVMYAKEEGIQHVIDFDARIKELQDKIKSCLP